MTDTNKTDSTETTPPSADEVAGRRRFLVNMWATGGALLAAAGAWTTWDLFRPLPTTGFGGKVRTILPTSVPESGIVEVPAARAYLTRLDGEIVALSEKCTHLGCRVPFCDSSGRFECPCHGSVFNRVGDYLAGPAPRGMDRYPVEEGDDGLLYIDTGDKSNGPEPGLLNVDEPARGPMCAGEGHS
jgi:cytochrome b6-f complex iron-sulfur subunit